MEKSNHSLKLKILIADDNSVDRLLLKTILSKQGHDVVVAVDGVEAVDVFRQEQPAIVLLDVLMPTMDGFEAAEKIKAIAGEDFIPIIFLTSLQETESLVKALDAGGDDFLSKPYNSVILQAKINAFSRMQDMHKVTLKQRDEIAENNRQMVREEELAKRVFDRIAHSGCLDASNIRYEISPMAVFNGDVMLAASNPSGGLVTLLGDFTGHGLHAAIGAMPLAQSFYRMVEKGFAIREIAREINHKLYDILPVEIFCCVVIAEMDFVSKRLTIWNAGMPDAVIYRKHSQTIESLTSHHIPLGISPDINFNETVESYEIDIGDKLFLWSDGVLEASNENDEMFGQDRLLSIFHDTACDDIYECIKTNINQFIGDNEANDDVSLVEISVVSPSDFNVSQDSNTRIEDTGPVDWGIDYQLRGQTLKDFDPVPLILQILMEVPYLQPHKSEIYTVITELYTNALEHGVLGLDSAIKDSPEGFENYYRLKSQLLETLQTGSIGIQLDYQGDSVAGMLAIKVTDSGRGFDYQQYLLADNKETSLSGRGLKLLASICDEMEFEGKGNVATATYTW